MGKIEQVRVSRGVRRFKKGLMERWGLKDYHDPHAPCYFFNINDRKDIEAVRRHKGFKLIHFVNARGDQFIDSLKGVPNTVIIGNPYLTKTDGHKIKWDVNFEIKDFSMFKPNPLGDKIYCYVGMGNKNEREWDTAKEIQKMIDYEIIYGIQRAKRECVGMDEVKAMYDKCFLNLNLERSGGGGLITATELGLMGRMTIMNTKSRRESIIPYRDIDEIVEIINRESKKIGTVQPAINPHNTGKEWLNVDFWK